MDAVKFIQEKNRMCASFGSGCDGCPLSEDSILDNCAHYINLAPDKAIDIVAKWVRENPIQTNGMKFKEVFGVPFETYVLGRFDPTDNSNHIDLASEKAFETYALAASTYNINLNKINKWLNEEYKEPIVERYKEQKK